MVLVVPSSLISGGTDTHLVLISLTELETTGMKAEEALGRAGIVANRDAIPFDPSSSLVTSGIRLGTPAVTTRGMKEAEMRTIAGWVGEILGADDPAATAAGIKDQVLDLCAGFPIPR